MLFRSLIPLSAILLYSQGFLNHSFEDYKTIISISYSALLGISGTAVATVLFYMLMKKAGPLFSSMVTYGIPFIALLWGLIYREKITLAQVSGLLIILTGVFVVNRYNTKRVSEIQHKSH